MMQYLHSSEVLSDTVYSRFKDHIINYRFRPGEQLQIPDLAERLRMGKTPLREALTRLHGESLVMAVANRGFFAKMLTIEEMKAHYELAFLVLRHSIIKNVAEFNLRGINKPMEITWDTQGKLANATSDFYSSHAIFIEALYERIAMLSDNKVMIDNIRSFNDQTRYVRLIALEEDHNIREITTAMCGLIDALESRNAGGAVADLEQQFEKKLAHMKDLVDKGNLRSLRSTMC